METHQDLAYKFSSQPGDWSKSVGIKHVLEFLKVHLGHVHVYWKVVFMMTSRRSTYLHFLPTSMWFTNPRFKPALVFRIYHLPLHFSSVSVGWKITTRLTCCLGALGHGAIVLLTWENTKTQNQLNYLKQQHEKRQHSDDMLVRAKGPEFPQQWHKTGSPAMRWTFLPIPSRCQHLQGAEGLPNSSCLVWWWRLIVWTQTPLSHSTALLREASSRGSVNFTCTFHQSLSTIRESRQFHGETWAKKKDG